MFYINFLTKTALTVTALTSLLACSNLAQSIPGKTQYATYSTAFSRWDRPTITVIDYQYSSNDKVFERWSPSLKAEGRNSGGGGYYGYRPVVEKLYVKWQLLETGEVFEDTADLRGKLPKSMERKILYFVVWDKQLNIYIADRQKLAKSSCLPLAYYKKNGPLIFKGADDAASVTYCDLPVIKVYPNTIELNKEREPSQVED